MELSPEDAARTFAEHGWHHLELSTEHGAALLERGDPSGTGERFRRFCADIGVSFPQGHLKLRADIAHPDPSERRRELEELKRWLDLFGAVGIRAAVLHEGGRTPSQRSAEELFQVNVDALGELSEHAAGGPIIICLENGPSAGHLLRFIRAVDPERMGICLDTGHLALSRAREPDVAQTDYEFITEAGPFLKALHLTDNDGSGDQHLFPYRGGKVDWVGVMRGLREVHYEGLFNFEVPGESRCEMPQRLAKLGQAAQIADALRSSDGLALA